jgi:ornithine carbamoyltransferase
MIRHFLSMQDLSRKEIDSILERAEYFKKRRLGKALSNELKGKTIALIFERPSTRTRISFEIGIHELGGNPLFLSTRELQLSRGETIADTARVLSNYVHGMVARVTSHNNLIELSEHSTVPVVNALSPKEHPCQILADFFTIRERRGKLEGLRVAWIGDGNNVCNSLMLGCSLMGMDVIMACPKGYGPSLWAVEQAFENAKKSGSKVQITESPEEAVADADIVYTDTFISMGQETETERRLKAFLPTYQVNERLLKRAKSDAVVLHCQPWRLGQEISEEVAYSPRCLAFDQAENKLHVAKALLTWLFR